VPGKLLNTALFDFEDRDLLSRALDAYCDGAGDFADYVIGLRNARAGCERTVTFDRALRGQALFRLL
jgi:predicted nucleic-acid-binding protein